MSMQSWYANLLLDHRWLKKRKEAIHHDKYTCQSCRRKYPEVTLCVHHTGYITGWMPWDYPLILLQTLCTSCHEAVHAGQKPIYAKCSRCQKIVPETEITGRDGKREWICEKCIQKSATKQMKISGGIQ